MSTIMIYKRLSEAEKKAEVNNVTGQLEHWFEQNPKRRVCRMDFFGRTEATIKRKNVREQVERLANEHL